MYTKPVSDIIQWYGLAHQSYADDTQLYMTMDHSNNNWRDCLARIQLCVSEIKEWMNLRGEMATWLKNSTTLESFKRNLKRFSSGNGSLVKQCYFLC